MEYKNVCDFSTGELVTDANAIRVSPSRSMNSNVIMIFVINDT